MLYAAYKDANGKQHTNIYYKLPEYIADTFSPETETSGLVEFQTRGKTYAERKQSVIDTAIKFYNLDAEMSGGLSWGELATVDAWFSKMARRYGLINEFRENGII